MKRSLIPFALVAVLASAAYGDRVDDLIKKEMSLQNIPGVSLLITKDDRVVIRRAYGYADLELKVPMRPGMVFETGSIGKSFTATVIMQFVEAGKIGLEDPLAKYIAHIPSTWKDITIRHLLSHTSGIPDYALVQDLRLDGQWTNDQWFARMKPLPLDFKTGSQFGYSNSNYLLLGLIAEKLGGHPIDQLVRDRIFLPLGMKHSFPADEHIVPNRVKGYFPVEKSLINGIKIVSGYGDGGEMNTCEDLATFEKGFREGKLVKLESVALMQTSGRQPSGRKTNYGFAWFDRRIFGHRYISHGGNTGGFGDSMTRIPEKNLTIIVMTNQAMVGGDGLAQKISVAFDPDLGPKPAVESLDPNPVFSGKLRAALVGLANRDTKQSLFSDELAATLATQRGQMSMPSYLPFKDIASFAFCSIESDDPDRIYRFRVKTKDHSYIVGFWVTTDQRLFSVSVRPE